MTVVTERVAISTDTVRDVQTVQATAPARRRQGAELVLRTPAGDDLVLPATVQQTLFKALAAIAERGSVTIGVVPEELTSTVAADLLGVSRPTLMKWVGEGAIESFKVGSHHRFRRADVLALRAERVAAQADAFDALRAWDLEHPELNQD